MKKLLILTILLFCTVALCAEEEDLVEVENDNITIQNGTSKEVNVLQTYRQRKPDWTFLTGVLYQYQYAPTNYDFIVSGQTRYVPELLGAPDAPLTELAVSLKYNGSMGSLSADVTAGYYKNSNPPITLQLFPFTFGLTLHLDNLFNEPYVVPYVGGGGYFVIYKEDIDTQNTITGNSSLAAFYKAGLQFQLDWLDPSSHHDSLMVGLQNTFVFLEARSFMLNNDPGLDLSTPLQFGGGLVIEY